MNKTKTDISPALELAHLRAENAALAQKRKDENANAVGSMLVLSKRLVEHDDTIREQAATIARLQEMYAARGLCLGKRDATIATLTAALEQVASARPDRLNCTQDNLWEVMRDIARAALAQCAK